MTGLPADLGDAGRAYVEAMPRGEIVAFPLTPLDTIGLPVWVVALFPDDESLVDTMAYGVGYGATDAQAALGALGECLEMAFPALTLPTMPRLRASWTDLVAVHGSGGGSRIRCRCACRPARRSIARPGSTGSKADVCATARPCSSRSTSSPSRPTIWLTATSPSRR